MYTKDTNNYFFFFSSRRRHTISKRDWSSDVCSSDLGRRAAVRSDTRAGGRRPAPAPRADARDRPPLEHAVRERILAARAAGPALDGEARPRARRPGQDVEEPWQHDRPLRLAGDHLGKAQAR